MWVALCRIECQREGPSFDRILLFELAPLTILLDNSVNAYRILRRALWGVLEKGLLPS
jgi:hypothetical protein